MRAGLKIAALFAAVLGACSGGGGGPAGNQAPVANAGPDQDVSTGSSVTLNGSGSSDPDGNPLTYAWSFTSKPAASGATLTGSTTPNPTFTADEGGTYVVQLVVNDGTVSSTPDTVTIVANVAPVANAGPDQSIATGSLVTLDGTASSDADGNAFTYAWSFTSRPAASGATLTGSTTPNPTFTADQDGTYVLQLVVDDGRASSAPDTVTITAAPVNVAPVANAGPDQAVATGALVALDGSGSSDANGDPLTYTWSFTSVPPGSGATLSGATTAAPTFTADVAGSYVVSLVVNDGKVDGTPDAVTIKALSSLHVPDTGQTQSYTSTPGEDADYATNPPSYTDNGDGTVTDGVTRLVWQRQDDGAQRTWDAAAAYCTGLSLPGTGWRLPTPFELITIQHFGRSSPAIDMAFFPGGRAAYYWSSYPFRSTTSAWTADFYDGGVLTAPKSTSLYVRCVRGDALGSSFVDEGNGTVADAAKSLVWQQQDDGTKKTWEQALAYCEGLSLGGSADWRLPNVKELASLEEFAAYPVADLTFFPTAKENYYWSSTTVASALTTATAWQVSFLGGGVGLPGLDKAAADAYVRCVRGQ